jgi:hypothetical protein
MTRKRRVTEPVQTLRGRLATYDKIAPLLDEREVRGRRWVFARAHDRKTRGTVPRDHDILDLHRAMFADVFSWAGTTRVEDRGPGGSVPVPWQHVRVALRQFADDLRVWVRIIGRKPTLVEIASVIARTHFRFEWIHPFYDTNGRTGRVLDHYLLWVTFGLVGRFFGTAPTIEYAPTTAIGAAYYDGLRAADGHDEKPLCDYYVSRLLAALKDYGDT